MPALYLMAGVISGLFAALSSFAMGQTALFALVMYSGFGVVCIIVLAMRVPKRRTDGTTD